jgi:hypothetical protein
MLDFFLALLVFIMSVAGCLMVVITCLIVAGTRLPDRPPEYYVDDEVGYEPLDEPEDER